MRSIAAAFFVTVLAQAAGAELITFGFTGYVTGVSNTGDPIFIERLADLGVVADASVSGEYVFDSATPERPDRPGNYPGAILFAQMGIGGWTLTGPLPDADEIFQGISVSPTSYSINVRVQDTPAVLPSSNPTRIQITLFGADPPVFEGTELPTEPPDPSLFSGSLARVMSHGPDTGRVEVRFELESLTLIPDRIEAILGSVVGRRGIFFQVASSGCTKKADFEVLVLEGPVVRVALSRAEPDPCDASVPFGTRIPFSYAEMGLRPLEEVVVANPRAPVTVPHHRLRRR